MSTSATRLPLAEAAQIAGHLIELLSPACERLTIAGSIRRGRPDVGDIELVAIPRFRTEPSSLWGDTTEVSVLAEVLATEESEHVLERISGGDRYVKLRHVRSGLQVDLFITTEEQWGLILLIRTGPADYSQWLVTEAKRRGHHVAGGRLWAGRGHLPDVECSCARMGFSPVPTPTEESVYAALGLPFVAPGERGIA